MRSIVTRATPAHRGGTHDFLDAGKLVQGFAAVLLSPILRCRGIAERATGQTAPVKEARVSEKASPLRERPLHVPGQSLDEAINRLWDDRGLTYFVYAMGFIALALWEWLRWFNPSVTAPWFTTAIATLVVAYCVRGLLRLRKQTDRLKLGRDGERAVAEVLNGLRAAGCVVYHDVVADGFNIDHIVLSARGVFVVETKTIRKPIGGKVRVDGRSVIAGGASLGTAPIEQSEANARWVRELLKKSTGRAYPVKPCLVFPGWFVEPTTKEIATEIWVLNPKALLAFIENTAVCIADPDLHMAAYHLSSYIRSPWAAGDGRFSEKILKSRRNRHAKAHVVR